MVQVKDGSISLVRYRRRRYSGGLRAQYLTQHATQGSDVLVSQKFTELDHRTNDVVLKRFDVSFNLVTPNVNDDQVTDFALVSKPRSEGVPVRADITDPRYSVEPERCMTGTLSTTGATDIDHIHRKHMLKIKVPMVNDVYFVADNQSGVTVLIAYLVKLFWALL